MNRVKEFIKRLIPDSIFLRIIFRFKMDKLLHLKHPRTFNEKLQWLKLHDRNPEYTKLVDKYEVKKIVAGIIGEQYIIPTYGVWNSFDEIDFNSLPNQFVLKCTHDSGGIVICTDKKNLNIDEAREKINRCLKRNYYWVGREWPYKNVKPRIIAEQFITEDSENEIRDYKFMCFNGTPLFTLVCSNRVHGLHEDFFDNEWNHLEIKRPNHPNSTYSINCPPNFKLMKNLAEKLSKNTSFLRVDFYEVKGKVYFGELTFFPASGLEKFEPEEWDYKFGSMISLNIENQKL